MIERIARALWFDHVDQRGYPNGLPTWDEMLRMFEAQPMNRIEEFRSYARAALAVMAEPTEAMLRAAERADIASFGEASHRKIWQAMIAAAAGEGK